MEHRTNSLVVALSLFALLTGGCMNHEVAKTENAAAPVVNVETPKSVVQPPPTKNSHDIISLPASFGNVSFTHKKHQDQLKDCSKCHEKGPGRIPELGKDWAHKTCKGCHTEMKKGPTSCTDCHKK